ncbi:hypothetical protein AF335_13500 [Streptomyces eurocidicus]|uniref:Uncharacterized protein n=1 Tax=Streptomyces eurocidicus TaxID=66423 RepID=A0A2N8NYF2_STREU|nr:hypothetical protein [Streptomyces eurocidicus]MBB5121366.1 hypothetical protein [Streptomyces eurocidicus]MBF6050971.1 hypothetical protein [Streptomyces eurocidicus]PNE33809.1 hypothetical protein AF335_13500 [Streptomyces eurocidicus]
MSGDTGGWQGDAAKSEDHLRLTADENRLVTQRWEAAREARGRLDGIMGDVQERSAASHGGKLEGLDYSLKGLDSFRRKVAVAVGRGKDAEKVVDKVDDLNRYTLTFEAEGYTEGVQRTYAQLRERGYEPASETNTWEDPVYKGVNTSWRHPETREKFELQFHTPESFQAKSDNHELYELARSGSFEKFNTKQRPTQSEAYQEASDLLQNERYAGVRIPPRVAELRERKVRATLNPAVDPEIVENVRRMEADLRAEHAAVAAGHTPERTPGPAPDANREQVRASSLGAGLGDSLRSEGPGLRERLAAKAAEAPGPLRKAPESTVPDPLPNQSRGRGPSLK